MKLGDYYVPYASGEPTPDAASDRENKLNAALIDSLIRSYQRLKKTRNDLLNANRHIPNIDEAMDELRSVIVALAITKLGSVQETLEKLRG